MRNNLLNLNKNNELGIILILQIRKLKHTKVCGKASIAQESVLYTIATHYHCDLKANTLCIA